VQSIFAYVNDRPGSAKSYLGYFHPKAIAEQHFERRNEGPSPHLLWLAVFHSVFPYFDILLTATVGPSVVSVPKFSAVLYCTRRSLAVVLVAFFCGGAILEGWAWGAWGR